MLREIIAPFDALRLLKVLLPYCVDPAAVVSAPQSSSETSSANASSGHGASIGSSNMIGKGVSPSIRLVALHVMAETLKHMPSSHLLPGTYVCFLYVFVHVVYVHVRMCVWSE